ncbi:NlpC/P60 family protein [Aliihoeflea sp. 2WW]|uniref:C40 family peptidase n=1 Tax=Aliihoeflea sp. 2WW TaxID=1381123 RepID=UPI0004630E61|nr:NlpC/P60 family protein [Aliihoeflea sp. 2WW]
MTTLDRRLHAFRPDLAAESLRGQVEAGQFVEGRPARIAAPIVDLRPAPRADSGIDTQLLHGATVRVFEELEGWAWLQADADGYVGYAPASALSTVEEATHVVVAQRSFVYRGADLRFPMTTAHSMGATVRIVGEAETRGTRYALLETGEAMIFDHLRPVGHVEPDYVTVAARFEHTPYLWGGVSGFGIDCSGLVQLAMRMAGISVLRDTDMQAASIGIALDIGDDLAGLRRGDLVFWKGHVAIMLDAASMIHASGHTMRVTREPLADAVSRIGHLYGGPTGFRRP